MKKTLFNQGLVKWIVNLLLIAIPCSLLTIVALVNNLYQNIWNNHFWANGNLYLMWNTFYIFFQAFVSIPVIWEIPTILKYIKPLRWFSIFSALLYNFLYFASICDFFYLLFEEEEQDLDVIVALLLFYNIEQNFPVIFINLGIIIKEFTLPFAPLLTQAGLHSKYKLDDNLSLIDFETWAIFLANIFNPLGLLRVGPMILGYDPKDWIIENPDDEEHWYLGKYYHKYFG